MRNNETISQIMLATLIVLVLFSIVQSTDKPIFIWQVEPAGETQTMRVTAFCPGECCCGKWADGITASGHVIKPGDKFVAAPKSIPFGTMVIVPGYANGRPVPVRDRGGAITDGRLDVFFDTHKKALQWGVKNLQVKIAR